MKMPVVAVAAGALALLASALVFRGTAGPTAPNERRTAPIAPSGPLLSPATTPIQPSPSASATVPSAPGTPSVRATPEQFAAMRNDREVETKAKYKLIVLDPAKSVDDRVIAFHRLVKFGPLDADLGPEAIGLTRSASDPVQRAHLCQILGELNQQACREELVSRMRSDSSSTVRETAIRVLARDSNDASIHSALEQVAKSDVEKSVRSVARHVLGQPAEAGSSTKR